MFFLAARGRRADGPQADELLGTRCSSARSSGRTATFRSARESSTLHRDERGGTLHGLLRVKHITQDDAHVFVTEDQIQDEIDAMIDYVNYLYERFGVTPRAELSTRPDKRLGTDEQYHARRPSKQL